MILDYNKLIDIYLKSIYLGNIWKLNYISFLYLKKRDNFYN